MVTTTTATTPRCNDHRWYQPAIGRYTRPDALGLPGALDFDDSDVNLFGYGVNNPLLFTDTQGQVSLPFDPEVPKKCRKPWRNKIFPRLQKLAQGDDCGAFFCKELQTNLPQLIADVFPFIAVRAGRGGELPFCPTGGLPGTIEIGRDPLCGSTEEALHVSIHELGHYGDCINNGDKFGPENTTPNGHYDGCQAEVACFGWTIGGNCLSQWYPKRKPRR